MTPTELWLPIGAAAFYLYDSTGLLWQNELMFTHGRGRWLVDGGTGLRLAGRRVFLPNPLLPMRPQFQVQWNVNETRSAEPDSHLPLLQALRPIGVINQLQLLLLLALPLVSWTLGAGVALLALFALFYVATLAALTIAWRRRGPCRIQTRAFWLLVLDALACAPFAVNLTRKISMRHGIAGDPLLFAARNLDPIARAKLRQLVAARVQEEHADAESADRERRITLLLSRLE
ncbi:MAG: hypothetical protein ABI645_01970 [Pseudomonadota bacterium]